MAPLLKLLEENLENYRKYSKMAGMGYDHPNHFAASAVIFSGFSGARKRSNTVSKDSHNTPTLEPNLKYHPLC